MCLDGITPTMHGLTLVDYSKVGIKGCKYGITVNIYWHSSGYNTWWNGGSASGSPHSIDRPDTLQ